MLLLNAYIWNPNLFLDIDSATPTCFLTVDAALESGFQLNHKHRVPDASQLNSQDVVDDSYLCSKAKRVITLIVSGLDPTQEQGASVNLAFFLTELRTELESNSTVRRLPNSS